MALRTDAAHCVREVPKPLDAQSEAQPKNGGEAMAARRAVWTRHWATGAAHSCVGSYGDRYGGVIADFWRSIFRSLTHGHRVLDLATGNGALPRLLLAECPETPCEIDAVDLAAIEPTWIASLPSAARHRVRFRGGQALEELPYANGAFDLIVSQYGIEYTDLDRSVPEMLRVLAAGGGIALVMHIVGSRPVDLAKIELSHLDWLLSDEGLLSATAALIEPLNRASMVHGRESLASDPTAEAARMRFNAAQDALRVRTTAADGADVLFEIQNSVPSVLEVAARQGVAPARERLGRLESGILDSRLRLEQLVAHALTSERCQLIATLLCDATHANRKVVINDLRDHGHLMGCSLQAQPRATSSL